jgi:hypothetical protein
VLDLDLEIRGRALLFKTIGVQERRQLSRYQEVPPNITLRQAADLLMQDVLTYDERVREKRLALIEK